MHMKFHHRFQWKVLHHESLNHAPHCLTPRLATFHFSRKHDRPIRILLLLACSIQSTLITYLYVALGPPCNDSMYLTSQLRPLDQWPAEAGSQSSRPLESWSSARRQTYSMAKPNRRVAPHGLRRNVTMSIVKTCDKFVLSSHWTHWSTLPDTLLPSSLVPGVVYQLNQDKVGTPDVQPRFAMM